MNIEKYAPFFHDGLIYDLITSYNNIVITMRSAQLDDLENIDHIKLGRFNMIRGKLHLVNISECIINSERVSLSDLNYKFGDILDLEFKHDLVLINVNWLFQGKTSIFNGMKFKVDGYFFENTPDLIFYDDADFDDNGRYIGEALT